MYTSSSPDVLSLQFSIFMNYLSSYCGLVNAKIRASDIDLPVQYIFFSLIFQPIDALLKTSIGDFLSALTDPDLNVRRVALVAFNSAAHNKPSLIRDLLRKYIIFIWDKSIVLVQFSFV